MGVPAALDLHAALPAPDADQATGELLVATRDVAALDPREGVRRVELPVPVGRKVSQAAQARVAVAARLLDRGALQERAQVVRDRLERLHEARLRRADRAAREIEHADHAS